MGEEVAMERNYVRVEFEALPQNQSFARAVAGTYCSMLDPTVEELTELKTAVSEAVSNAVIHGYRQKGKGRIVMELEMTEKDRVRIRITDFGTGISDVKKAMEPMFSTRSEKEMSGMGFTVMESFMDRVNVTSKPGEGTVVTLMKCLDVCDGL